MRLNFMENSINDTKKEIEQLYTRRDLFVSLMVRRGCAPCDAEDIVQEAFCRALRFADKWKSERGAISTWFNSILYNCFNDWNDGDLVLPQSMAPEEMTEDLEEVFTLPDMAKELVRLIDDYPNLEHRDILQLTMVQGFADRDTADIMGVTHEKVRKVKYDFKKRVRNGSGGGWLIGASH